MDHQIDRAVRAMLDREPPADLRARVLARIDRPGRTRGPMLILAPVAAVALIVLAVFLRPATVATPQPTVAVAHVNEAGRVSAGQHTAPLAKPQSHPDERVASRERPRPERVVAAATLPTDVDASTPIAPLQSMEPIAFEQIATDRISPDPVSVAPLRPIADVQIAPLTPPDGRH